MKQQKLMEESISGLIVRTFFSKLEQHLAVDVAIVGAGPSGLVAARDLANAGFKVAIFESKLAPGGGVWGGGMLMNEVVIQDDAAQIINEFGITTVKADDGYHTADSVEMAAGLIFGARKAGAVIFNAMAVEDVVVQWRYRALWSGIGAPSDCTSIRWLSPPGGARTAPPPSEIVPSCPKPAIKAARQPAVLCENRWDGAVERQH